MSPDAGTAHVLRFTDSVSIPPRSTVQVRNNTFQSGRYRLTHGATVTTCPIDARASAEHDLPIGGEVTNTGQATLSVTF